MDDLSGENARYLDEMNRWFDYETYVANLPKKPAQEILKELPEEEDVNAALHPYHAEPVKQVVVSMGTMQALLALVLVGILVFFATVAYSYLGDERETEKGE
jgi:hypothetical protein